MTRARDQRSEEEGDDRRATPHREGLARLRHRREFERVYKEGTALRGEHVVLIFAANPDLGFRSAVVASRKVGPATVRNRAKRLLREAVRHLAWRCERTAIDVVLVARRGLNLRHIQQVTEEIGRLSERAGIVRLTSPYGIDTCGADTRRSER